MPLNLPGIRSRWVVIQAAVVTRRAESRMPSYIYDSYYGVAVDEETTLELTRGLCKYISILLLDFGFGGAVLNLSYDGITFGDDIYIMAYFMPHVLDISCRSIKIRRKVALDAEFNILAYYGDTNEAGL